MGNSQFSLLENACRITFSVRLGAERGLQMGPELVALAQITWEDFSRIMMEIYGHQVTDHNICAEIETLT